MAQRSEENYKKQGKQVIKSENPWPFKGAAHFRES